MKHLSLVLSGLALFVAALLLYIQYAPKKDGFPAPDQTGAVQQIRIAFVNIDTLHERSSVFQAKKAELEKRQADAEKALQTRGQAFQREIAAYQKKIQSGNITPKEAQETEERLARIEQEFNEEKERLAREILQDTDAFNQGFTEQVKSYLEGLKAELGYDAIIFTGSGSPVITYSPAFDITTKVLDLLNANK